MMKVLKEHQFDDECKLELLQGIGSFFGFKPNQEYLCMCYLTFDGIDHETGEEGWYCYNSEYFPVNKLDDAIAAFELRKNNGGFKCSNKGYRLEEFLVK